MSPVWRQAAVILFLFSFNYHENLVRIMRLMGIINNNKKKLPK